MQAVRTQAFVAKVAKRRGTQVKMKLYGAALFTASFSLAGNSYSRLSCFEILGAEPAIDHISF
jgi:hypothetical protein